MGLLRGLLRRLRPGAGVDGMLIRLIRLRGRELNSLLRARIGVLDRLAVGGGQLIEFVDAVADGLGLTRNVFLTRERFHVTPKAFTGLRLQGLFIGGGSFALLLPTQPVRPSLRSRI